MFLFHRDMSGPRDRTGCMPSYNSRCEAVEEECVQQVEHHSRALFSHKETSDCASIIAGQNACLPTTDAVRLGLSRVSAFSRLGSTAQHNNRSPFSTGT